MGIAQECWLGINSGAARELNPSVGVQVASYLPGSPPHRRICKLRLIDHERWIDLVLAHLAGAVDHEFSDHTQLAIDLKQ